MNYSFLKNLLMVCIITLVFSCSTTQNIVETRYGSYQLHVTKSSLRNDPVIYGTIYEYNSKTSLESGAIRTSIDIKDVHRANRNGYVAFTIKPGVYKLTGLAMPYLFCETKSIAVGIGDSVSINFYLKPYTKNIPEHKP